MVEITTVVAHVRVGGEFTGKEHKELSGAMRKVYIFIFVRVRIT